MIDQQAQELVFEVALGGKAEEVKKVRVPLGHGIAGLCAMSGQPMAIAEADRDQRQAAEIAQRVGYMPRNILCVPLVYGDQVVGVFELLDKVGATAFSPEDMTALGLFANQAAVAIEQSRTRGSLAALIVEVMSAFGQLPADQEALLQDWARELSTSLEADPGYHRALDLAGLVTDISQRGENELAACRTILQGFAQYLRSRPDPTDESWAL